MLRCCGAGPRNVCPFNLARPLRLLASTGSALCWKKRLAQSGLRIGLHCRKNAVVAGGLHLLQTMSIAFQYRLMEVKCDEK